MGIKRRGQLRAHGIESSAHARHFLDLEANSKEAAMRNEPHASRLKGTRRAVRCERFFESLFTLIFLIFVVAKYSFE